MVKTKQNGALRNKFVNTLLNFSSTWQNYDLGMFRHWKIGKETRRREERKIAREYFPRTLRGLCSLCTPDGGGHLRMVSPKACSPILAEIRALPRGRPTIKQRRGGPWSRWNKAGTENRLPRIPRRSFWAVKERCAGVLVALSAQPSDGIESSSRPIKHSDGKSTRIIEISEIIAISDFGFRASLNFQPASFNFNERNGI